MAWEKFALRGITKNVQSTTKTTAFSTTSTSMTDVTGLSVTITPTSASSKVLVIVSMYVSVGGNNSDVINLVRGSTAIAQPAADTYSATMNAAFTANSQDETVAIAHLDNPATTSATTYKIQMRSANGSTSYVCRRGDVTYVTAASTITAMEVLE